MRKLVSKVHDAAKTLRDMRGCRDASHNTAHWAAGNPLPDNSSKSGTCCVGSTDT